MFKKLTATAVAAVLAVALVACGSDAADETSSEDAETTTTASPDTTTTASSDGSAGQAEYCAIEAEIDAVFETAFSGTESPTPEAVAEAATQVLDEFADEASAAVPDEFADELAVLLGATEEAADGDAEAFDTPEVQAAATTLDEFCGVAP